MFTTHSRVTSLRSPVFIYEDGTFLLYHELIHPFNKTIYGGSNIDLLLFLLYHSVISTSPVYSSRKIVHLFPYLYKTNLSYLFHHVQQQDKLLRAGVQDFLASLT